MDINIYEKYEVEAICDYSYISQEDSIPGDLSYKKDRVKKTEVLDGGKLIDLLYERFSEDWIQSFQIKEDTITFEYFNAFNGTGGTCKYKVKSVGGRDEA